MPLPELEYYALSDLSKRWRMGKRRLMHYVETGKLRSCVWLKPVHVKCGKNISLENGEEKFQSESDRWIKGFVRLLEEDCRWVLRDGVTELCQCESVRQDGVIFQFLNPQSPQSIRKKEVVVMKEEVQRFEAYYLPDLRPKSKKSFYHSADYQTVQCGEFSFRFGMVQAAIIRELHIAGQTDNPWVHGKILLDKAGSRSPQLRNLFCHKKDWREVIESDGRGYYRLNWY